jgi:hypothetical protein
MFLPGTPFPKLPSPALRAPSPPRGLRLLGHSLSMRGRGEGSLRPTDRCAQPPPTFCDAAGVDCRVLRLPSPKYWLLECRVRRCKSRVRGDLRSGRVRRSETAPQRGEGESSKFSLNEHPPKRLMARLILNPRPRVTQDFGEALKERRPLVPKSRRRRLPIREHPPQCWWEAKHTSTA